MRRTFDPYRLLLISVAGWLGQQQRAAINYLREENRVLREQLRNKRLRLNDDQHRRLAAKAKTLGRRLLREAATIVTATHTRDQLDRAIEILVRVGRRMNIIE